MLTPEQQEHFVRDGFVLLPGAIPLEQVETALHHINYQVGQGIPQEQLNEWRARSFFPELANQPAITDLFNTSGLRGLVGNCIGPENVAVARNSQLALRFPREPGSTPPPVPPHIDGLHTPNNGVPAGTLYSFTALAGVFLTDVNDDFAGNFTVWPGSHRKMEAYFQQHGIDELLKGRTPPIEGIEPVQIKAKAGDAVLAHYQLLHGVAANVAPRPRFAVFFRIKHPMHDAHRLECLTDIWKEWPGIQAAASALA